MDRIMFNTRNVATKDGLAFSQRISPYGSQPIHKYTDLNKVLDVDNSNASGINTQRDPIPRKFSPDKDLRLMSHVRGPSKISQELVNHVRVNSIKSNQEMKRLLPSRANRV
mmetsp:Transcript_35297/g.54048  ORF Transcript_35297/g.54048 Transcript_35297/m.54048 type:complete len:111 (-) Transcript_35297:130-462(-)